MKKKKQTIVLMAFVSGQWHTFKYENLTLEQALQSYEMDDALQFWTCWDYGYHPIDVLLPDGTTLKLMRSVMMADYCWGKGRVTFGEYMAHAKKSRVERDAVPYLYHMERTDGRCCCHEAYETPELADKMFEHQHEHVLLKQGYVKVADDTTSPDCRSERWHKDGCPDMLLTLTKKSNKIYA